MTDDVTEPAQPGASEPKKPARPRSVQLATAAVGAQLLFAMLFAGLSWGFSAQIRKLITDSNAKAHPPKTLCDVSRVSGCLDVTKQLHTFRLATTQSTVLISILVVLLTVMFRRGSGVGRWIFIVLCVIGGQLGFAGTPLQLLVVTSSLPKPMGVAATLSALAAIVAIVLLVVPASARWFREMKLAANPGAAQRPVGLGALFAPRRPAERPARQRVPAPPDANPARAKAKAKVRADADAVAKGAELARSRAKANKSRRSD